MITRLPYVLPDAYAICPPRPVIHPGWYVHARDGGTLHAWLVDRAGVVLEEVGSGLPDFDVFNTRQGSLPRSAGYHRAARLFHLENEIRLYDWAAGEILAYQAPDPWTAGPPQWVETEFRWIEWIPADVAAFEPTQARLMVAGRDFVDPTERARLDVSFFIEGYWDLDFRGADFTSSRTAIYIRHLSEQEWWVRLSFTSTVGGSGEQGGAVDEPPTGRLAGWPAAGGSLRLNDESAREDAAQLWDGGLGSDYLPWIPASWPVAGEPYDDLFIDGGDLYLLHASSGAILTSSIPPAAEPTREPLGFPPGQIFGFCNL